MNRFKFAYSLGFAFTLAALVGCASLLGPERQWERHIGVIDFGGGPPSPIDLPDTVVQGVPFVSTVTTFGSGNCVRADGADVHVSGLTAHVTPYDLVAVTGVCTDDLAPYPREVTLQFDEAGEATVWVHGRTVLGEPVQYEARTLVLPGD